MTSNVNRFYSCKYEFPCSKIDELSVGIDRSESNLKISSSIWDDLHKFISDVDLDEVFKDTPNERLMRLKFTLRIPDFNYNAEIPTDSDYTLYEWICKLRCLVIEFPKLNYDTKFYLEADHGGLKFCVINAKLDVSNCNALIHVSNCKSVIKNCESLIV